MPHNAAGCQRRYELGRFDGLISEAVILIVPTALQLDCNSRQGTITAARQTDLCCEIGEG